MSRSDRSNRRSIASILLLTGAAAGVLWFLVHRVASFDDLADAFGRANPTPLAIAAVFACLNLLAAVWRWQLVLAAMGAKVAFRDCLRIILGVFPLTVIAPARVAELLRGVALRDRLPVSTATASVVVERVVDVLSLLTLILMGALGGGHWLALMTGTAVLGLSLLFVRILPHLLKRTFLGTRLSEAPAGLARFSIEVGEALGKPRSLVPAFLASCLSWGSVCLMVDYLLAAYSSDLSLSAVVTAWPVAVLVGALPITLAGIGTRDGAFLIVLVWMGVDVAHRAGALAATLSYAALGIWSWALVGIPFMVRLGILQLNAQNQAVASQVTEESA